MLFARDCMLMTRGPPHLMSKGATTCLIWQPAKFDRMLDISLSVMFFIYASVGLAGYLMYGWLRGDEVRDRIGLDVCI